MPDVSLQAYEHELRKSGVAPRHVRRTMLELADHFDDLAREARESGADDQRAAQYAIGELGEPKTLAAAARSQPELLSWAYRFPYAALIVYPLVWMAVTPVFAGVDYAPRVVRWSACLVLGALVTGLMILMLQLSITLT